MSYEFNTYIGPAFKIKKIAKDEFSNINCCSNINCINHLKNLQSNDKFCTKCGSPISKKVITFQHHPDINDLTSLKSDIYDFLFMPIQNSKDNLKDEFVSFMPNYNVEGLKTIYSDHKSGQEISKNLLEYLSEDNLNIFINDEITKEIYSLLKEKYSEENIKIEILFIQYFT